MNNKILHRIRRGNNRLKAFTLAEVLITLAIIGVVAALTIPSVVVSYQKRETVTKLKKMYMTFSQAMNKAIADYGSPKTWQTDGADTKEIVDKYIAPYLNVVKNCGYSTSNECEFEYSTLSTPNTIRTFDDVYYKLILQDGSTMYFVFVNSVKSKDGITVPRVLVNIFFDINGKRKPNLYGKDLFEYQYLIKYDDTAFGNADSSGRILPLGGVNKSRESYKDNCSKTTAGQKCAGLIMIDGWEIKDDYPW